MAQIETVLAVLMFMGLSWQIGIFALSLMVFGMAAFVMVEGSLKKTHILFDAGFALLLAAKLMPVKNSTSVLCVNTAKTEEESEREIKNRPLNKFGWIMMIGLLQAVIAIWSVMLASGWARSWQEATTEIIGLCFVSLFWFLAVFFFGNIAKSKQGESIRTNGYLLVKRMCSGMALTLIVLVLAKIMGLSLAFYATTISIWAILFNEALCEMLKDRSVQLGIFIVAGIAMGLPCAVRSLLLAYVIVVVFYHIHHLVLRRPLWPTILRGG